MVRKVIVGLAVLCVGVWAGAEEARLLRFPDIHKDRVAFVYAGDIWIVSAEGGLATRLTSHEGMELFPKFSPDGKWIAFSGEYGGNRQVFVISVDGKELRQLTYYNDVGELPPRGGFDYQVLDWTPDGKRVLFRANRLPWSERMGRYYTVPVDGGLEEALPIPEGGTGMFSPDGKKIVYTPIEREWRTWKRYRGGRAQDVWIYDLENNTAERLTDYPGTDNLPVWVGNTIYFTSDREHTLNLYAYDLETRQIRKVTHHTDYDVLWPSAGPDQIVYECGGYLYRFDPKTEQSYRIPVQIISDLPYTRPYLKNVRDFIEDFALSPSGARALFSARGDIFTVPAEHGEIRNLTRSQGIRELYPAWSPDGQWIAYVSDRSGEYEIYVKRQDGSGEERRLTHDGDVWRFAPVWSPDSKRLAFADKAHRLRILELETGKIREVDRGRYRDISDYCWAPDGRWLAYVKAAPNRNNVIWVYSLDRDRRYPLTDSARSSYGPAFDPQGQYLYFLSDRDYNLTFSSWEFNYVYTRPTRVYAAPLARDGKPLFVPKSDEEKPPSQTEEASPEKKGKPAEKSAAPPLVRIDVQGFEDRAVALPITPGRYSDPRAAEKMVYYLYRDEEGRTTLKRFNIEEEKEETVLEGISGYDLSRDGKKILFRKGKDFGIVEAKANQKADQGLLKLDDLVMKIDPRAEWNQIFQDGWRILRDWFYDPNMHGVDWPAMREKYGQLVPHVAHRADLDFLLGEMGGELNAGHVYVNWGDHPRVKRVDNGLLGAELAPDPSGYFRIAKIFPGENWHEDFRCPLRDPGVHVKEGEYLIAIDGQIVRTNENPYKYLENKAGHVVTLLVNAKPTPEGAREVKVRAIKKETNLRYLDWVRSRMHIVDSLSGGRIGYIHLPNTSTEGNRELFKHFYAQFTKEALIIDVRYNGGGFIPDRMIELLDRPLLNYWVVRGLEPWQTPAVSHQGPKVCLINGYSSSGGDAFPYYFRKRGLGKLIGTRTWGGLIGLSGNPGFVDGGSISVPTFRFLTTEGMWDVENIGVAPDIEVVDRPDLVARGHDPTLEKAVEVLLEELHKNTPRKVSVPPPPDESK
ncbi:MAG: PDZ domain-containing protein [candidate division KSB1 bacterium]|nr:PDZ domain-containing protein [candidate division KSB1 bacterium]